MEQWSKNIQTLVDEIDRHIRASEDDGLTLASLARACGYSEYYVSRNFREISGMSLRDYLRGRRLAFALRYGRGRGGVSRL